MTKTQQTRMVIIGLCITGVIILAVVFVRFFNPTPRSAQPNLSKNPTAELLQDSTQQSTPAASNDSAPEASYPALVTDDLLTQEIPQDAALVKDELAQLDDIQQQLEQQKQLLEQQHRDADELIRLKEQQLAQLEQQLNASS